MYIIQGYGLTETSPTTHALSESGAHMVGSVGHILPNLEARLVDAEGEVDAEEGQPGELWLRGPTIMKVCLLSVRIYEGCFVPESRVISTAPMLLKMPLPMINGSRLAILRFGTKRVTIISSIAVKS